MALWEKEGFCPDNQVTKKSCERLKDLWSMIGQKIVCDKDVDQTSIVEMFTTDAIAHKVISKLIEYHPIASRILVKQPRMYDCKAQSYNMLQDQLKNAVNPRFVTEVESNFATIVSYKTEDTVLLQIWDLRKSY